MYFLVTGLIALLPGLYLLWINNWDPMILMLIAMGAFFVLFYTWPLKYLALGEVAVLLVWGPLMIGGGYYVLAHEWDWNVVVQACLCIWRDDRHLRKASTTDITGKRIFTIPY
jgi:1,4-dihydroxy-2-naphthoate octaprenyltransferase